MLPPYVVSAWMEDPPGSGYYSWVEGPSSAPPEALVDRLTNYVKSGSHSVSEADSAFISDCISSAVELVNAACGDYITRIPEAVLTRAYVEAGSELYNRRSAPNGISQFSAPDGTSIRLARDPMVAARPLIQPYLPLGIG